MPQTAAANHLKLRLRDLLLEPPGAFSKDEFGDLVRVEVPRDQFDWDKQDQNLPHPEKVWKVIEWAEEYGEMKLVLWLAERASARRPKRDDLKQMVIDLRVLVDGTSLPKPLAEMLALARAEGTTTWDLAVQLRAALDAQPYPEYDLPGQFHLSDVLEERLLAVLALEAGPNPAYVRWLAERVTVEPPLLATLATKALIVAARVLGRPDLPRLEAAVHAAQAQLKAMVYVADPPVGSPFPVNLRARGYHLRTAEDLVDIRTGVGLPNIPTGEADGFLGALLGAFKEGGFRAMCAKRLGKVDGFVAHPTDPDHLVIIYVVRQLREVGRITDLIWAACDEKPLDGMLKDIRDRFGGKRPEPNP